MTMHDLLTESEGNELINIRIVIKRAEDAIRSINSLMGNKEENALAISLAKAHEVCALVLQGKENRKKLRSVIDTISQAKNTIEMLNLLVEYDSNSYFTSDLNTAWFNTYKIMSGDTDYRKYN